VNEIPDPIPMRHGRFQRFAKELALSAGVLLLAIGSSIAILWFSLRVIFALQWHGVLWYAVLFGVAGPLVLGTAIWRLVRLIRALTSADDP